MVQLHPSFRRLLHEYIPRLKPEDLETYDSLLALRWQLVHKRSLVSNNPQEFDVEKYLMRRRRDLQLIEKVRAKCAPKPVYLPPFGGEAQTPREEIDELIRVVTEAANSIIQPYRKQFDALQKLWSARRNLVLHQGGILQMPSSLAGWRGLSVALFKYYGAQATTASVLVMNALKNPAFVARIVAIIFTIMMLLFGVSSLKPD